MQSPPPTPSGSGRVSFPIATTSSAAPSTSARRPDERDAPALKRTVTESSRLDQMLHVRQIHSIGADDSQHLFSKCAQIITLARHSHRDESPTRFDTASIGRGGSPASGSSQQPRMDRWFNLELEDVDIFKEELKTWRQIGAVRGSPSSSAQPPSSSAQTPSMVFDVLLDTSDIPPNRVLALSGRRVEPASLILLERWTLSLLPTPPDAADAAQSLPIVYKHMIVLIRALHGLVRALPTWDLFRASRKRGTPSMAGIRLGCRLSAGEEMANEAARLSNELDLSQHLLGSADRDTDASTTTDDFHVAPVHTPLGFLHLDVRYRPHTDFTVEDMETVLTARFLDEDYFSPARHGPAPASLPTAGEHGAHGGIAGNVGPYGSMPIKQAMLGGTSPVDSSPSARGSPAPSPNPALRRLASESYASQLGPVEEGAFATLGRQSRYGSLQSSNLPAPLDRPRRPSIGTSHPFKQPSPTLPVASPRDIVSTNISSARIAGATPMSASPGPPGFLRYSTSASSSAPYYDAAPYPASAGSSSPRSISGRPGPMAIRRYSSTRGHHPSSLGDTFASSSSSPPIWGPESIGRRARLASMSSQTGLSVNIAPETTTASGSATASGSSSRRPRSPADKDDIAAFLDSLSIAAPFSTSESRRVSKREADERLRALAGSVYGDAGPPPLVTPSATVQTPSPLGQGLPSTSSRRSRSTSRPTSFTTPASPILDEDETVGRLELSQEEGESGGSATASISRISSPGSTRQASRDQSMERGAREAFQLGRGRGRPGRFATERGYSSSAGTSPT